MDLFGKLLAVVGLLLLALVVVPITSLISIVPLFALLVLHWIFGVRPALDVDDERYYPE